MPLAASGFSPDLLINNAGLGDYGEFATAEWPKLESLLRVNIEALTHLQFIAKHFERIADQATNIAEQVQFADGGFVAADRRAHGEPEDGER